MSNGEGLQRLRIDRSRVRGRKRSGGGQIFSFIVLLCIVAAIYLFRAPLQELADRFTLPKVRVVMVEKSHPSEVGAVKGIAANGYIVAARRAALSADTPGRIVEIRVREGSAVKKGDLVARLYDKELEAALQRAIANESSTEASVIRAQASLLAAKSDVNRLKASVSSTKASLEASRAELTLAQKNHTRNQKLVESRALNKQQLDRSLSALDSAKARVLRDEALSRVSEGAVTSAISRITVAEAEINVARAQVTIARAAVEQARATLEKTKVRAPFSGVVVLKDAELGEVVSPNSQGGGSSRGSVVTMVDFDSLEVQADVPETSLASISSNHSCQIFLDAYPNQPYSGRVDRIWPTADRQKATIEVRVVFLTRDDKLRPEMGVRVVFLEEKGSPKVKKSQPATILIPNECLVKIDGRSGVFILERNRVRFQEVLAGKRMAGRVAISKGLTEGDKIVFAPPVNLQDGDRVQRKES